MLRWLLAASHLLALGIGLGAVWVRGRALQQSLDTAAAFRRVFAADAGWGLAALLWLSTGLWRLLGGSRRGPPTTCRITCSGPKWDSSCWC